MESRMLVTWKEIAAYLRVSVPTARRWHQKYRLPVCRSVGKHVRTSTSLIDRWLAFMEGLEREVEARVKAAGKAA